MLTNEMKPIKFWCQKVLPLVYDDSLSYYEVLAKTVDYLNNVIEDDKNVIELVNNLEVWVNENKEYIDNYFENLNVQNEINVKLDEMVDDGTFGEIIDPILEQFEQDAMGNLSQQVSDWLEENITPTTPVIDATLTISGAGADAKVTGDKITDLKNALSIISESPNLYNAETIESNKRIDSDGGLAGAEGYYTSAFIPVIAGEYYEKNSPVNDNYHRLAVYSSADVTAMIPGQLFTDNLVKIHDDGKYIRFCGLASEASDATFKLLTANDRIARNENAELTEQLTDGTFYKDYPVGNLYSEATDKISNGYYYNTDSNVIFTNENAEYSAFILEVTPNTDYICTNARFLLLMSDKTNVISRLENLTVFNTGDAKYVAISFKHTLYPEESYCINQGSELTPTPIKYNIPWLYHPASADEKIYNGVFESQLSEMSAGNIITASEIHAKKNTRIIFEGMITNLQLVEIGKGRNLYTGASVEITPTDYTVYKYTPTKTQVVTGTHGLTLDTFLKVIIITKILSADIIIMTKGGSYTIENVEWDGSNGSAFAVLNYQYSSQSMTNVKLKFVNDDYSKDIYVFGDSYVTLGTDQRWPYYVLDNGFDPFYLDGYGGRNSASAITSFRNAVSVGKPKHLLWAMGMNDADTESAVNASWKTCVDEVIAYCADNGIDLVLATIPCTPTQRNEFKNQYVKSTGLRYIDFAKAVNGEAYGDTWYPNYLASDNVHPLALGAEALAYQAFMDMPELMHN